MSVIDIGTVLNKFDDTYDEQELFVKEYGVRFITMDGRLRTLQGRKNVKSPQKGLQKPLQERGKFRYNLKRNGTMLLFDLDIEQTRAVKVSNIIAFRDCIPPSPLERAGVRPNSNWLRVFH